MARSKTSALWKAVGVDPLNAIKIFSNSKVFAHLQSNRFIFWSCDKDFFARILTKLLKDFFYAIIEVSLQLPFSLIIVTINFDSLGCTFFTNLFFKVTSRGGPIKVRIFLSLGTGRPSLSKVWTKPLWIPSELSTRVPQGRKNVCEWHRILQYSIVGLL